MEEHDGQRRDTRADKNGADCDGRPMGMCVCVGGVLSADDPALKGDRVS